MDGTLDTLDVFALSAVIVLVLILIFGPKPERVKEGWDALIDIVIPCPKCGELKHKVVENPNPPMYRNHIKCGACGYLWKYRDLNMTEVSYLFDHYVHRNEPQPQLPPRPELNISPLDTASLMFHHCNGDVIIESINCYDDSTNNLVSVENIYHLEDVLKENGHLDTYEEEVYCALKKAAEAGLQYVYFYQG